MRRALEILAGQVERTRQLLGVPARRPAPDHAALRAGWTAPDPVAT